MKYSAILFVAILFLSVCNGEEGSTYEAYSKSCEGYLSLNGTTYQAFFKKYFMIPETMIMNNCSTSDFTEKLITCSESQKTCAKSVQQFMWDRCHWRILYEVGKNNTNLYTDMKTILQDEFSDVWEFLEAMHKNDAVYDFATKCASWDWKGIGIMVLVAFFGSYVLLWIIGGIMKCCKGGKKESTEKTEKKD